MSDFKINFSLQPPKKIKPFGEKPDYSLHWFGLTDGILSIDICGRTIYEYTAAAQKYFKLRHRYNDYYISRFMEDFFGTFEAVGQAVPKELYCALDGFNAMCEKWEDMHADDSDEIFDKFYFEDLCGLRGWYDERTFDSSHLTGGPMIGCFRHGDKIKIIWNGAYKLDNGADLWSAPSGCAEIPYSHFTSAVNDFYREFFAAMDRQCEIAPTAINKKIRFDAPLLSQENDERKRAFSRCLDYLYSPSKNYDWDKIMSLYEKMKKQLKGGFD